MRCCFNLKAPICLKPAQYRPRGWEITGVSWIEKNGKKCCQHCYLKVREMIQVCESGLSAII